MNNYSKIYWLTRLDGFNLFSTLILVISLIGIFAYYFIKIVECDDSEDILDYSNRWGKIRNWFLSMVIISSIILLFVPTQKEAIIIIAGGKTIDYVQSDTSLQKIPQQTTKIISEYLDKTLNEIKENK